MSAIRTAQGMPRASHEAGSFRGSLKSWLPPRLLSREGTAWEREVTGLRVEDLYANDGLAKSSVNALGTNVIGAGLVPQSVIPAKRLGISPEQAKDVQDQMEWLWTEWCAKAHYSGRMTFAEMQRLAVLSLIRNGEFLHLPLREKRPTSRFALCLQDIRPTRLRTPFDRQYDPHLCDGVELSPTGVPVAYWIANPAPSPLSMDTMSYGSGDFRRIPAAVGHWPGMFHVFRTESEEQHRGVSCLAPVVKFFRHLNDSIDYELMGQVLAAAFPVFIGRENGAQQLPGYVTQEMEGDDEEMHYYQDVHPGSIMYGNKGEKPEVLESKRPSPNFVNFCELVMHIMGSALEIPYEVLTKDFTKTTYSSARAALMEAWRVYELYRNFMVSHYCQIVWEMVQEEAWLRGYLTLPVAAPDFYAGRTYWCNTRWIGPARGYVDPLKEVQGTIMALDAGLMSRSEAIAERGGDFDEICEQLATEKARREELGIADPAPAPVTQPTDSDGEEQANADA